MLGIACVRLNDIRRGSERRGRSGDMSRLSSTARGETLGGRERKEEPRQRSRQRANREREAEAHRNQYRSSRRDAVGGEERDHGELSQAPAADRDWDEYHADHDREQHRRVGERQREALRPSDRPDDENGERVDDTSD